MNKPTDAELIAFAAADEFLLFCAEDEFVQIARAVLDKWGQPVAPTPEDQVFELLRGVDSLDALAVWRAVEAAHGIK
jgi:acyl carrier protein